MSFAIRILSLLPLRVLYAMASYVLYPLLYYVVHYRRSMVLSNLRYCYPEKSEAACKQMAKQFYHWFADLCVEIIHAYRMSDEELRERVVFEGLDEVQTAFIKQRGGVFMLGHIGCWEWIADAAKRMDRSRIHTNVIYLKLDNPSADRIMMQIRQQRGCTPIEMHKLLREAVRLRKESSKAEVYSMLADQKPSWRSLQFYTDFFGHNTPFLTGSEKIARKFAYPVYYADITMPSRGHYHVQFIPITANAQLSEEGFVSREYVRLLEANIRKQPSIWLWSHNRFKWNNDK